MIKKNAKEKAVKEAELYKNTEVEVAGITQEWAIKECTPWLLFGAMDNYVTEVEFVASSVKEALAGAVPEVAAAAAAARLAALMAAAAAMAAKTAVDSTLPQLLGRKRAEDC